MKDLKNIIVDLWELFFPLLIRSFISFIILRFIFHIQSKEFLGLAEPYIETFINNSRAFLVNLKLDSFFGVYLLIVFILTSYTFNSLLILINSIFRVSIYWLGFQQISPYPFSKLSRYFPAITDPSELEREIRKLHSLGIKDNINKLADEEKWFSEKLTRFGKYTDIVVFEILLIFFVLVFFREYVSIGRAILVLLLMLLAIFFFLSRTALSVKEYYNQVLYKIELIVSETHAISNDEAALAFEKELLPKRFIKRKWWGIQIRIIGDIRETFKNFGSMRFK